MKGERLDRAAVFTYFPHDPGVPDWLPPAVAVHRGDWKLIRIFHGGDNGAHRYLLFNLRDDLGEKTNLASARPDLVAELDALIEAFLTDTGAIVPLPNPAFDPARYHPELEGQQKPRTKSAAKKPAKDDSDPKLQGWKARNCDAAVTAGIVTVKGTTDSPFLGVGAGTDGPAAVTFHARSAVGGTGKVEWIPPGTSPVPANSAPFTLKAGDWQSVTVHIAAQGPLGIVRIYLPAQKQAVEVDWIELRGAGKPRRWDF
ncbi:MAG: hypothetical protein JJ992_08750, partial [Planctomycetes bacterium]|nr:hypothetical protein [Planctomycetota bacterium]